MTQMNHNRPQFRRQEVWIKHDQFLPSRKRAGDQRQQTKKPSAWLQQLRTYDGQDPYLVELAERDACGESVEEHRQKAAGKLGWYFNQHVKAVSALIDTEARGDLGPRGRELLNKLDGGDDLTGSEVWEVEQMAKSAA